MTFKSDEWITSSGVMKVINAASKTYSDCNEPWFMKALNVHGRFITLHESRN